MEERRNRYEDAPPDQRDRLKPVSDARYQEWISFENERHERSWLTTTAMNICKDKLKHWWRQKVTGLDEETEQIAAEPDEKSEVVEAVMALPVKYKEVVWLHYYEGYQTDEIAEMLHRPPSTVRGQLRDARAKLKLTLGGERI